MKLSRICAHAGGVILSTLLTLVVLEIGLRFHDGVSIFQFKNLIAEHLDLPTAQNVNNDYDPLVGWVIKSNIKYRPHSNLSITTGDYGIRMNQEEPTALKPHGILAVGDSFAAGSEVANAQTWPAFLERDTGIPVSNAGSGGFGLDQVVLRAESLTPVLEPSVIIVSFTPAEAANVQFSVFSGGSKPWFSIKNGQLVEHNIPVVRFLDSPHLLGFWRSILGYSHLANTLATTLGYGKEWWDTNEYIPTGENGVAISCLLLRRIKAFADDRNISLFFLIQYNGAHLQNTSEPANVLRVAECASEAKIETLDTWEPLREIQRKNISDLKALHVMHGNAYGHLSPTGNELVAQWISERLHRNNRLQLMAQ
jgi:hypothetical protein